MTMAERKECDEREKLMWDRGYRFGLMLGAALIGLGVALLLVVTVKIL